MTNGLNRSGLARVARLLFWMSALGEIGVGILALLFPRIIAVLMAAPLSPPGLLVARMLGSAALALGATWWIARKQPLVHLASRYLAGYLIYNLGMGVLFAFCAVAAGESTLPWVVSIGHVLVAVGFTAAVVGAERSEDNGENSA